LSRENVWLLPAVWPGKSLTFSLSGFSDFPFSPPSVAGCVWCCRVCWGWSSFCPLTASAKETECHKSCGEHPACRLLRLGFLCPSFLHLPLCQLSTAVVGGVRLLSFCYFAIAESRRRFSVFSFWALLLYVAASTPYTLGGLLAVCPDVPKLLAVVALRQASLSPIGLHLDNDVAHGGKLKYLLRFVASW
jgi:hypothetical protein